jgi:hypothetical protein
MLPWNTCGDTQGLVRITPAKQYRMQLHVAISDRTHRPAPATGTGSETSVRSIPPIRNRGAGRRLGGVILLSGEFFILIGLAIAQRSGE